METFRTKPPRYYLPPDREEMRDMAKKVELKAFAPDLVADLTNLAAGGELNPPSVFRGQVLRQVQESLPQPDKDGEWKLSNGKYTKDRQQVITERAEAAMKYHQNIADFLQSAELDRFPGVSPLEQAMSLLKLLSKQKGGQGGAEGGEPGLPIFQEGNGESVADKLHEVMETVDSLTSEELDMLDPDGNYRQVEDSPEGDGTRTGHQALNRLAVAEDLMDEQIQEILKISRKMDEMSVIKPRRERRVEPNPEGEEVRMRPMRDYSELSRIPQTSWAMKQQNPTLFWYQAATRQLPVRERVRRMERKQAIFVLVDGSGSMSGKKHWKATGVVMNRLKAVLSGDAEVWVGIFDTQLGQVTHAATKEEAQELIKQFKSQNFSGGGTNIATSIKSAHQIIDELMKEGAALYRPEVMILTDEDSSSSDVKPEDVFGTKVHGFAMETKNAALMTFCQATGGLGFENF